MFPVFSSSPTVRNTLKNSRIYVSAAALYWQVVSEMCPTLHSCSRHVPCIPQFELCLKSLSPSAAPTWYTSKFNSASNGLSPLVVSAVKFKLGDPKSFSNMEKARLEVVLHKTRDGYRWISRLKTPTLNVVGTLRSWITDDTRSSKLSTVGGKPDLLAWKRNVWSIFLDHCVLRKAGGKVAPMQNAKAAHQDVSISL